MKKAYLSFILMMGLPLSAMAHSGAHDEGLISGFMHPMTGLDHLLVILAVGFWSSRSNQPKWQLPLLFVSFMLIGGLFGASLLQPVLIEWGITASILAMAMVLMLATNLSRVAQYSLTGLFAVFHGIAHGQELILSENALSVVTGMVLATVLLVYVGLYLGRYQGRVGDYLRNIFVSGLTLTGALFLLT